MTHTAFIESVSLSAGSSRSNFTRGEQRSKTELVVGTSLTSSSPRGNTSAVHMAAESSFYSPLGSMLSKYDAMVKAVAPNTVLPPSKPSSIWTEFVASTRSSVIHGPYVTGPDAEAMGSGFIVIVR